MLNNLGIFINNTNSQINYEINLHNFNILKNNFNNIIIIDSNNDYALKLKILINNKDILKYINDNAFIKNNTNDFDIDNMIYILNNITDINKENYKYITFINDNYIYLNDCRNYLNYIISHNLKFCAYTDSTEIIYHYQMYLFTILSTEIEKLYNFVNNNTINKYINIESQLLSIFDNKMPFIKVAYLTNNTNTNIFYCNIYKDLLMNSLLPIININMLNNLNNLNKMLPSYIRDILHKYNLLDLFDVPYNFNLTKYKELNPDLSEFNEYQLINHWFNYGKNENRQYY